MNITEVRVSPSKGGKIRAFASIVIDDCFIINDLRVMEGREHQLFVTMPARKARGGQLREIAHPLNSETRRSIEEVVLAEFRQAVDNHVVPATEPPSDGGKPESRSPIDRLAAKLFSDEFWTTESSRQTRGGTGSGG